MKKSRLIPVVALCAAAAALTGCTSSADRVSENISKEAEQFKIVRSIVGVNGITDKVEFQVVGRCSVEGDGLGNLNALTIICKEGPGQYKKHFVGMSDNMFFISTQIKAVNVSEYRTKFILKPENIVPDFDLQTSGNTP